MKKQLLLTIYILNSWGCTCFAAMGNNDTTILGRNFDWYDHIPLLLFTDPPDGFASVSMVDLDYFGFNRNNLPDRAQNKRRLLDTPWLPFDGLNERGVAIGMRAIDHAEPPSDPGKKTVGEIEVIRLVLDYAQHTEQAVNIIKQYHIRMENPPIHYLIADSSGHSAILELVGGKMIVMRNNEPWMEIRTSKGWSITILSVIVPHSINIPWANTAKIENLRKLDPQKTIIVCSENGQIGQLATTVLSLLGYHAVNMLFGMMDWNNSYIDIHNQWDGLADYPVEKEN